MQNMFNFAGLSLLTNRGGIRVADDFVRLTPSVFLFFNRLFLGLELTSFSFFLKLK